LHNNTKGNPIMPMSTFCTTCDRDGVEIVTSHDGGQTWQHAAGHEKCKTRDGSEKYPTPKLDHPA
jgi:hypothetical protein